MNREIKFKAKLGNGNWENVTNCFWDSHVIYHNKEGFDDFLIEIKHNTICQLITKSRDVEIYEYDCFLIKDKVFYGYYDKTGELTLRVRNIDKTNYIFNDNYIEYDFTLYYMYLNSKANIIGNWHDGEEYLLNKIKEVGNE